MAAKETERRVKGSSVLELTSVGSGANPGL